MDAIQSINLIAINPGVRSGRPYIIGTTVTVVDVAMARLFHHRDADQIAEDYQLTLPQVYSALAYYYDHKAEIDESVRKQIRRAEELKEQRVGNEGSLLSR
ncbi:MAG: DUF433 domain-containing protein [Chloroflexota bacterium]